MCRPTVMHVFMFNEGFILETTFYPNDRPTSSSGAAPPADRSVASDLAKNGAPWLCGNLSCMSTVSVALGSGEPLLIHCVEKRTVSRWPEVHRPRWNLGINKGPHLDWISGKSMGQTSQLPTSLAHNRRKWPTYNGRLQQTYTQAKQRMLQRYRVKGLSRLNRRDKKVTEYPQTIFRHEVIYRCRITDP